MARLPRIIIPNTPHHVTQRGNRRQPTFFSDEDYKYYLSQLKDVCEHRNINLEAFCLMPNHIHLILTPPDEKSLVDSVAELHWRYSRFINFKLRSKGNFWQGRFYSVPLSDEHFNNCVQYVEQNPLRAKLENDAFLYPWRSRRCDDVFKKLPENSIQSIRKMTRTGRPQGNETFMKEIEKQTGIDVRRKRAEFKTPPRT